MAERQEPLTWIERLWGGIKVFFETQSATIWRNFLPIGGETINQLLNKIQGKTSDIETEQWETMLSFYKSAGILSDSNANNIMQLKDQAHPYDWVFYITIMVRLFTTYLMSMTSPGSSFLDQGINEEFGPGLPQPTDILKAAFIAPEKTAEVRTLLRKMGLKKEHIDLMFLSQYRLYDENMIRVLWLRKVLTDDEMFMRMRELGYTDTRTREMKESWTLIPGPQDLFYMVGKEAFEPDAIALMGLGDEFPEAQMPWLEKQGVSREWAERYWYAHWDQPSIQQGFEMLHRGVINWEELNMLFKTVELPPFWREKLTQVAFQVYTRVDTRRMHDMGVLDDTELVQAYKDQGYDDTKALKMAQFTVRYNQQSDKQLTKAQILTGYKERLMSKPDAKQLLIDIEFKPEQADYFLLLEDYKVEKEYQDDMISNIKDRYQNRMITLFDTRTLLDKLNLPTTQRDLLLDKWEIRVLKDVKKPSKGDLDKFLKRKIIDADTYRQEMESLGYNFRYTAWYESLARDGKPIEPSKMPSKADLDKFLKAGIIDFKQYAQELERLQYSPKYFEWYEELLRKQLAG